MFTPVTAYAPSVFIAIGGGNFSAGATIVPWSAHVLQYPTGAREMVLLDFDRDGKTDLAYGRDDGFDVYLNFAVTSGTHHVTSVAVDRFGLTAETSQDIAF